MRIIVFGLCLSMIACLAIHTAGCERQASEPAACACEVEASARRQATEESADRPDELHEVIASIAEHDLELAAWVLEMWRQDANQCSWGRLKYCLSLEEPERSECLRKVKGDD